MRRLVLLFLVFVSLYGDYWPAHMWGDARVGTWRNGGGGGLFVPYFQAGNMMLFFQGYAGRFRNQWVASGGVGVREMLTKDLAWGLNAFADYGHSDSNVDWFQGGFGGELMGDGWEIRANVYIPELGSQLVSEIIDPVATLVDTTVFVNVTTTKREEKARWGFDTEGGIGVGVGPGSLWGYLGYYRFANRGLETFQGPQARVEYRIDMPLSWGLLEVTVAGEYTHDDLFGHQMGGFVNVRLPLFCQTKYMNYGATSVCRRMANRVMRMNGLILRDFTDVGLNSFTRELLFYDERLVAGPGTQADPTSLNDAIGRTGPNDFLFGIGKTAGDPVTVINGNAPGDTITLVQGQTLVSFDQQSSVTLDFGSGATLVITPLPGQQRINLQQGSANPAVTLADGTTVFGNRIAGLAGAGNMPTIIEGTSVANVTIEKNELVGLTTTTNGILLTSTTGNGLINGNTISDIGGGAIPTAINLANASGQTVQFGVEENTITGVAGATSGRGIVSSAADSANVEIALKGNVISDLGTGGLGSGILFEKTGNGGEVFWVADGNRIESSGAVALNDGIVVDTSASTNPNVTAAIVDNRVDLANGLGIDLNLNSTGTGTHAMNALLQENHLISVAQAGGHAIRIHAETTSSTSDVWTIEVDKNVTQGVGSGANPTARTLSAEGGRGTMNLTVTDNMEIAPGGTLSDAAYFFTQAQPAGSDTKTMCLTMTGNEAAARTGTGTITLDVDSGNTMNVTNLGTAGATLSSNNNNLSVDITGTGTPTDLSTNCPTPNVPGFTD